MNKNWGGSEGNIAVQGRRDVCVRIAPSSMSKKCELGG